MLMQKRITTNLDLQEAPEPRRFGSQGATPSGLRCVFGLVPRRPIGSLLREVSEQGGRGLLARIESAVEGSAEVERIDAKAAEEGSLGAAVLVFDVMVDATRPGERVVWLVGEAGVGTPGDGHAQVASLDWAAAAAFDQAGETGRTPEPGEIASRAPKPRCRSAPSVDLPDIACCWPFCPGRGTSRPLLGCCKSADFEC
jgi:hypothetical protein